MSDDAELPKFDLPALGSDDEHTILQPGDILLVSSTQKLSSGVNRLGQAIVRLKKRSRFSHAALSLGAGLITESLTSDGVRIKGIYEFLRDTDVSTGIVLRPRDQDPLRNLETVFKQANYYYRARYNWWFLLRKTISRDAGYLFCSEFIARVFQGLGYPEFRGRAEQTLPIDLERLGHEPGWKEFKLADLLLPWITPPDKALGGMPYLEGDPKLRELVARARRHEEATDRIRGEMQEQQKEVVAVNDETYQLTEAMKELKPLQALRNHALLLKIAQCRNFNEQKALLEQEGLWPCWTKLPNMASFLEASLNPSGPQMFASENTPAIQRLREQLWSFHLLQAHTAIVELIELVTKLELHLVTLRDIDRDSDTLANRNAIAFLVWAYRHYAPVVDQIGTIRDKLGESLSRSSELLTKLPNTKDGQRLRMLWELLNRVCSGLVFVMILRPFRPDADIAEQAPIVAAIGDMVEKHQPAAAALRGIGARPLSSFQ